MEFFIPQTPNGESAEVAYAGIVDSLKDQLRWTITPRRIFGLKYVHDKKTCSVKVGQLGGQGDRYMILAIFESNHYIVYTRGAASGGTGTTILVNKDEVTSIEDFS